MQIQLGLTTWNVCLGRIALVWRWNMSAREALRTCALRRYSSGHGYVAAGALIVEW